MKKHFATLIVLGGATSLLLGACGTGAESDLATYTAEAGQALTEMDEATHRHHEAVAAATDADAIRQEEARYAEEMHAHWDTLDRVTTGFDGCQEMGGMMGDHDAMVEHMSGFHDGVHAADGALQDHWDVMNQAADVGAMHAEEEAHWADWQEMLDAMEAHHDALVAGDGEWSCPGWDGTGGHHHDDGAGGHMMDGGWGGHMGTDGGEAWRDGGMHGDGGMM